jgi:uracil-DNA glycosylase
LADEWRRYLSQQAELGGAEVILGAPRAPEATTDPMSADRSSTSASRRSEPSPGPEAREERPEEATGEPKWKRGAPPIPGPGIAVLSPAPVLLGNDLGALETLDAIAERIRTTYCCELCPHRTNAVPGEGHPKARMVLIGEGPGATEDATGRPFVGQAGQLLETILEAIEVPRTSVYIRTYVARQLARDS